MLFPAYPLRTTLVGIPSNTMPAAAAAVTLLRLPLTRLSSHLHSLPSLSLPPPRLHLSVSHRLFSTLLAPSHGLAVAAVAEAVAAPDAVEDEDANKELQEELPPLVLPRLPRPKLSVKERKELATYAHGLGKKLKWQQVGKGGVTPSVAAAFTDNLESNELLKLKIHGNCPGELPDVILQLEESTGSIVVDQIGRSVILYRPSTSKMKKREEESARNGKNKRTVRFSATTEERPSDSPSKRFVKSAATFRTRQKRRPVASKGALYKRG